MAIVKEKHRQVAAIMAETGIDCWITFVRSTMQLKDPVMNLIVGGDVVWPSAFVFTITHEGLTKTAIIGNFDEDHEKSKGIWDETIPYTKGISQVLSAFIDKLAPTKIALNYSVDDVTSDGLSHGMYLTISSILNSHQNKFVSAAPIIQAIRSMKTETELELITKSCELAEEINSRIMTRMKPGMTEIEIQNMYHAEMGKEGVIEAWQRTGCPAVDAVHDPIR